MPPWQVFIESNTTGTGRRFAALSRELGQRPCLFCTDASRYPYIAEDELDARIIDTGDRPALLRACRELASDAGLSGVGSSSEYFIETSAAVARELGLHGPDPNAVALCRDKHAQRECFKAAGVGSPRSRLARSLAEGLAAAAEFGWPVVAKPREGSGSIGVRLCANETELREQLAMLLARDRNERGIPVQAGALVEEFARGPEFSVEVFDGRGIALVQKHLGAAPFFVEVGHDHPAGASPADEAALKREAERAVQALGLVFGPAHVELRLAARGPVLIEVNPRLAGGWIPELVRLATGIDLVEQTVRRLAGLRVELARTRERCASIRFLMVNDELAPAAVEEVRRRPGVAEVALYPPRADAGPPRGDFRDRVGHVLTVADSRAQAQRAARDALLRFGRAPAQVP